MPTLCPTCRMQRRFSYRNERQLYKRTCDLSGRTMISFYPASSPFTVYDKEAWWSDAWDGISTGRDISFERPFFTQVAELRMATPRQGMMSAQSEGSFYSAYCVNTKNCYMCVSCVVNEDSQYCYQANDSQNCLDCHAVSHCELCYECISSHRLFSCVHCRNCENSSGLAFCEECRGCTDCIGCKNLINKKYCIFNVQVSAEEYAVHRKRLASHTDLQELASEFKALCWTLPTRATHITQCEHATGDHLRGCRNVHDCFDATGLEDCAYISPCPQITKDAYDAHYCPQSELINEGMSIVRSTQCLFSLFVWDSHDVLYSDECFNCNHLFGCVGLRHKEYCILNRQYSKEEYDVRVQSIIEHMRSTSEWGEYFPIGDSPFGYNETIAMDEYPESQEEVLKRQWRWTNIDDDTPSNDATISSTTLPDAITETDDDILQRTLHCSATGKPYKLTSQELLFYRQMILPIPRLHPRVRYENRMQKRSPRRLYERTCQRCGSAQQTTYAPDQKEKIFCEECFVQEIY